MNAELLESISKTTGGESYVATDAKSLQASLHDVLNTLVSNKVVQHQITLAEGLTSEQIVQRLLEADILAGNIREIPREGSMLPESYRFPRGTPRDQALRLAGRQRVSVCSTARLGW